MLGLHKPSLLYRHRVDTDTSATHFFMNCKSQQNKKKKQFLTAAGLMRK